MTTTEAGQATCSDGRNADLNAPSPRTRYRFAGRFTTVSVMTDLVVTDRLMSGRWMRSASVVAAMFTASEIARRPGLSLLADAELGARATVVKGSGDLSVSRMLAGLAGRSKRRRGLSRRCSRDCGWTGRRMSCSFRGPQGRWTVLGNGRSTKQWRAMPDARSHRLPRCAGQIRPQHL